MSLSLGYYPGAALNAQPCAVPSCMARPMHGTTPGRARPSGVLLLPLHGMELLLSPHHPDLRHPLPTPAPLPPAWGGPSASASLSTQLWLCWGSREGCQRAQGGLTPHGPHAQVTVPDHLPPAGKAQAGARLVMLSCLLGLGGCFPALKGTPLCTPAPPSCPPARGIGQHPAVPLAAPTSASWPAVSPDVSPAVPPASTAPRPALPSRAVPAAGLLPVPGNSRLAVPPGSAPSPLPARERRRKGKGKREEEGEGGRGREKGKGERGEGKE